MDNYPLISIALSTYNGSDYLRKQLDSLVNQTYPNIEIIVVDDCSIDNSLDILQEYESKYSNISVFVNERNLGVNQTFSKVISLCKGKFIAISDQDDIWLSDKIQASFDSIKNDNVMVYSNSQLIDENDNDLHRRMFRKKELYSGNDPRALAVYNNIAGHTIMFRSELKQEILPIPRYSHYDWWISFVAANFGNIAYMNDPYVMHRVHSGSTSGQLSTIQQDSFEAMHRWTKTMLSLKELKYKSFFKELDSILSIDNELKKKARLLYFQIKYQNIIFNNKGFFSKINRARKLSFPYIPDC